MLLVYTHSREENAEEVLSICWAFLCYRVWFWIFVCVKVILFSNSFYFWEVFFPPFPTFICLKIQIDTVDSSSAMFLIGKKILLDLYRMKFLEKFSKEQFSYFRSVSTYRTLNFYEHPNSYLLTVLRLYFIHLFSHHSLLHSLLLSSFLLRL